MLYDNQFVSDLKEDGTYKMGPDLRKFAFREYIEEKRQILGEKDIQREEVMDEDLMISNPVINVDDTVAGIDKSRYVKERRKVFNINSIQRDFFRNVPVYIDPKDLIIDPDDLENPCKLKGKSKCPPITPETAFENPRTLTLNPETGEVFEQVEILNDPNATPCQKQLALQEVVAILNRNNVLDIDDPFDIFAPFILENGQIFEVVNNFLNPNEYIFPLNEVLNNVKSVRLLSSEIPNTIRSVFFGNNFILLDVRDRKTGKHIPVKFGDPFFLFQIPEGNYSLAELARTMENITNREIQERSVGMYENLFSINFDINTGFFEIMINDPPGEDFVFHWKFFFDRSNLFRMLFYMLGFRLPWRINPDGSDRYTKVFNNLSNLGDEPFVLGNTELRNIAPFRAIDLFPETYIYLIIQGTSTVKDINESFDIFAKVQLNVPPGQVAYNTFISNPVVFLENPLRQIDQLKISWVDYQGNPVDFNFRNHSFAIEFTEYVDVLTINNYSSYRGAIDQSSYSDAIRFGGR